MLLLFPQVLRADAEPNLHAERVDMGGEFGGVLAPGFAALPEQPFVGIGTHARHAAERVLLLDDQRRETVIVQPQRAGHARWAAPDDRHDRPARLAY